MSTGDELHKAAERLREVAEAATPGPWKATEQPSDTAPGIAAHFDAEGYLCFASHETWRADGEFIALMDPTTALLVADWLDLAAMRWEVGSDWPSEPLALARHVNGEA